MGTVKLRSRIKATIDLLPPSKLRSAEDFVTFLANGVVAKSAPPAKRATESTAAQALSRSVKFRQLQRDIASAKKAEADGKLVSWKLVRRED